MELGLCDFQLDMATLQGALGEVDRLWRSVHVGVMVIYVAPIIRENSHDNSKCVQSYFMDRYLLLLWISQQL